MKNYYLDHANQFGWGPKHTIAQYRIDELLPFVSGNKILDVGCGPGSFVDNLSRRGFSVVGIDITPKFISFAKKNFQGKFIVGDALNLPFESKSFDTVFIRSVLEHLQNDLRALKEALRVGKKVIIIVPQRTADSLKKRGLIYSHYQDQTHLRTYTQKSIELLVSQTKSKLINVIPSEKLPNQSVIYELINAPGFIKRAMLKVIFFFFKPTPYHLELIAIIKS